ncbi:MAG: response regulator [Chitinispirillaceae bacterium]|nr:response regulator [Chitinispirillaceae bacterium]
MIHGVIFDITQRKVTEESKTKLEQQLFHSQKLEAIGTLAGGIAHDFNNILWIISGYADLALRELPVGNSVYNKLFEIRKATDRAKEIVKQLLTFSRKMEPKKMPIDVRYVIVEVLSFLRSSLPSTIELHSDIQLEGEMIMGDPTQVHQVIMNLCVNASQAMENRGGTIWVKANSVVLGESAEECFKGLPRGSYIKISVEDNGPGIPPEIIDRIFEPYFTTREVGKGSGMGLAVVHGIVKNHGGVISVKSEVGKGAIFTLLFPSIGKREGGDQKNLEDIENIPTGKECILFVDDEEAIVAIAKMILEELGYVVTAVKDPFDAIDLFSYSPELYNLVITDMIMPGMSGMDLFRELRKIRSEIPVILCTGHSDRLDEKSALDSGVNAYIMKPISRMELASVIRKVLDTQSILDSSKT